MKKNCSLVVLISILSLTCNAACIKQLCESKEERAARKLEKQGEQKKTIEELNKPKEITIKRHEHVRQSVERYILPSETKNVAWQLKLLHSNPDNCLEIETVNTIAQTPSWNPDETPCYYIWKLHSKSIGRATLQFDQVINNEVAHSQWVNVVITN